MATNEEKVVYGTPWQPPTAISPSAQRMGDSLAQQLGKTIDLTGTAPAAPAPAPAPKIGGASNMATVPTVTPPVDAQPQPMPATPGNEWGSLKDKWGVDRNEIVQQINNATPTVTGGVGPSTATPTATQPSVVTPVNPNLDPVYNAPDAKPGSPEQLAAYGSFGNARSYAAEEPGRTALDNAAKGGAGGTNRVVVGESKQIGESKTIGGTPFEPSIGQPNLPPPGVGESRLLGSGAPGAIRGASTTPTYETNYTIFGKDGQQGTASIVGANQRAGGGTVSAPDQGNGGTVEGNVAALNRQTAALTSLREARNPGITTGTGAFAPQAAAATIDPFALPGDKFGDSQMRRANYEGMLKEAATGRGMTKSQRATMFNSAQGLVAPGIKAAELGQAGQHSKDSLAAQLTQNQAASADRRFGAETASQDRRYAADASLAGAKLTAEQQAEQNKIAAFSARTQRDASERKAPESGRDLQSRQFVEAVTLSQTAQTPQERAMYAKMASQLKPGYDPNAAFAQPPTTP